MCGRVTETDPARIVAELSITGKIPELDATPRYNIAPSALVPVVRVQGPKGGRELELLRWGLVPHWAKDPTVGNRLINARVETLTDKPAFRDAFRLRRCLVVVDGFYEWQRQGRMKQPFHIRSSEGALLAMAGLWERWMSPDGEILDTFAIVTKPSEDPVKVIHDRMPAILSREHGDVWLDPSQRDGATLRALVMHPSPPLVTVPVSARVNKPDNDDPECLAPVAVQPTLFDRSGSHLK